MTSAQCSCTIHKSIGLCTIRAVLSSFVMPITLSVVLSLKCSAGCIGGFIMFVVYGKLTITERSVSVSYCVGSSMKREVTDNVVTISNLFIV